MWADAVAYFRTQWAAVLTDTVTITRQTSPGTLNPATGAYSGETRSTIYTGPAIIRLPELAQATLGEDDKVIRNGVVRIPATATPAQPGDRITVDACALDPELVGAELIATSTARDSWLTRRDIAVTLVEGARTQ